MGTFSTAEFWSLAGSRDAAAFIRESIASGEMSTSAGAILYFPPGDWLIRGSSSHTLVIPEWVEVMVAPKARVIPVGDRFTLEIRGNLRAPIGPIFATGATAHGISEPLGIVRLAGEQIERLHPEWWGAASGGDAETDTQALEAALFAARWRFRHDDPRLLNPLIVELLGQYKLRRTLLIDATRRSTTAFSTGSRGVDVAAFNRDGSLLESPYLIFDRFFPGAVGAVTGDVGALTLRGRMTANGESTFRCADDFVGEAMIHVGSEVSCLALRAVSFDAATKAGVCVAIDLGDRLNVTQAPHELHHCTFRGAMEALVRIVQLPPAIGSDPTDRMPFARSPGVQITACRFFPSIPSQPPQRQWSLGLRQIGPVGGLTDVRGCVFAGQAAAMIHASGVGLSVTSCRFQNTSFPESVTRGLYSSETHKEGPEGGIDIFLDNAVRVVEIYKTMPRDNHGAVVGDVSAMQGQYIDIAPTAPCSSLTAQDCRSSSPQFLVTSMRGTTDTADSTVIGLHHDYRPDPPLGNPTLQKPPAIDWRASYSGEFGPGASLTLYGCRFDGIESATAAQPRVQAVNNSSRPAVIDYGIFSGDPGHRGIPRPGVDVPGMVSPILIGFVLPRP